MREREFGLPSTHASFMAYVTAAAVVGVRERGARGGGGAAGGG